MAQSAHHTHKHHSQPLWWKRIGVDQLCEEVLQTHHWQTDIWGKTRFIHLFSENLHRQVGCSISFKRFLGQLSILTERRPKYSPARCLEGLSMPMKPFKRNAAAYKQVHKVDFELNSIYYKLLNWCRFAWSWLNLIQIVHSSKMPSSGHETGPNMIKHTIQHLGWKFKYSDHQRRPFCRHWTTLLTLRLRQQ